MLFTSINSTNQRTNPWNFHEKILRIGGAGKWVFFESAILNFLNRPFWILFSKKFFFASFSWKQVKVYWLARMGQNFDQAKRDNTFWTRPNILYPSVAYMSPSFSDVTKDDRKFSTVLSILTMWSAWFGASYFMEFFEKLVKSTKCNIALPQIWKCQFSRAHDMTEFPWVSLKYILKWVSHTVAQAINHTPKI